MNIRRHTLTLGQKVMLWCGVALNIWLLIQIPSVFNALLNFFAVGAVPGTNITLSPDEVLRLVAAAGLLLIAILVYRVFVRRPRMLAVTTAPPPASRLARVPRKTPVAAALIMRLRPAVRLASSGLRRAAGYVSGAILTLVTFGVVCATWLWQGLRPYVQQFDRWLDKNLNAYPPTAAVLEVGRDFRRALQELWRKAGDMSGAIQSRFKQ